MFEAAKLENSHSREGNKFGTIRIAITPKGGGKLERQARSRLTLAG
jgi:hypothetical protein